MPPIRSEPGLKAYSHVIWQEAQPLMLAARLEPPPAVVLAARSGSGALDLCSARSLLKADSINRHCSLDSKLRSIRLKGRS